jgi:hypothetical protein
VTFLVPSAEYRHVHYVNTQSIILVSVCHTPSVVDTAQLKRLRICLRFHFLLYFQYWWRYFIPSLFALNFTFSLIITKLFELYLVRCVLALFRAIYITNIRHT